MNHLSTIDFQEEKTFVLRGGGGPHPHPTIPPRHMGEEANTGRSGRIGLVNQGLVSVSRQAVGDSGWVDW